MKIITENKKAYFDYFIEERIEAGIVLKGSEVKSVKMGHISIKDSFCFFESGVLTLKNCLISPYEKGSAFNESPLRDRGLLLHKKEIERLIGKVKQKGYTLVPLKVYFSRNFVKVELGLCKGKHAYDKKESIKQKDVARETEREIANYM